LPFTKLGSRVLIHVPTAREWILSQMKNMDRDRARKRRAHNSKQQT
jgi:hypothetical protein